MSSPGPYYQPPGTDYGQRPRTFPWLPIVIGVVLAIAATVILLVLIYPAAFGFGSSPYPYRFGFGGIFVLFFVLVVVFFIVRVAFWSTRASRYGRRYGAGGAGGGYGPNRPLMVARMRYARGEITREQYDQIVQDLTRRPGSP